MNEILFQRACQKWVNQGLGLTRVNGFMDFIIQHDESWMDDCTNLTAREHVESMDRDDAIQWARGMGVDLDDRDEDEDEDDYLDRLHEQVLDADLLDEPAEVYEWYMVDYADPLEDAGEVIYRGHDGPVWGRCTTGQSVILDHVVRELFRQYGYCWFEEEAKERGLDPVVEAKAAGMVVPEWAEVK